jgi:hypothetical protein
MQLALLALTLAAGAALVLHYPSLDQLGRHP